MASRLGVRVFLAGLPAALLGIALGLAKIVRDCSLTCNVGFELAPLAILAIASLALPLSAAKVRAEAWLGRRRWAVGSALLAGASFIAFRYLTRALVSAQEASETGEPWTQVLRFVYLGFYVWVGTLVTVLGAAAVGPVFRLFEGPQRERGFAAMGVGLLVGGLVGSLLASRGAGWFVGLGWRFERARDALLVAAGLVLMLQAPVHLLIDRFTARSDAARAMGPSSARLLTALGEVFSHLSLSRLAALLFTGGVADTLLKYLFYWLVSEQTRPDSATGRTLYFSTFYLWLNGASLVLLAFASERLIRRFGLTFALLSLPVALALGATSLAVTTALAVMYVLKIVEGALHSSIYEPGVDHVYLHLEPERAEPARVLLHGLVGRLGEGAGAILVLALTFGVGVSLRGMLAVLLVVLLGWTACALAVRAGIRGVEGQQAPAAA